MEFSVIHPIHFCPKLAVTNSNAYRGQANNITEDRPGIMIDSDGKGKILTNCGTLAPPTLSSNYHLLP